MTTPMEAPALPQLKRCPFCGPLGKLSIDAREADAPATGWRAQVCCAFCSCRGGLAEGVDEAQATSQAVRWWNLTPDDGDYLRGRLDERALTPGVARVKLAECRIGIVLLKARLLNVLRENASLREVLLGAAAGPVGRLSLDHDEVPR